MMSLKEYRRKRSFRRTPEPRGNGAVTPGRTFVVQKHAARQLHYDFRLELDGALKSWAVPKGPSLNPANKSLAVHVEDHPLEYAAFEGVIPQGEYGGGTVMVWDHGTWEPEGDPDKQYAAGKLTFHLHGEKLRGAWSLVRMGGRAGEGGKNWLLIKRKDRAARKRTDILDQQPRSVLSGREMREIAADADRVWRADGESANRASRKRTNQAGAKSESKGKRSTGRQAARVATAITGSDVSKLPGARRSRPPVSFKPQLAKLASDVPAGENWLHELKFDGYRMLAFVDRGVVSLVTRSGNDWTKRFTTIAAAVASLPIQSAILDGEVVSLNEDGLSDFQRLQNQMKRGDVNSLVYYLFDVPFCEGFDLTQTPLSRRKELLARLLLAGAPGNDGLVRYSDHIQGQGPDVLAHACRYAMEGVVSKRAGSAYQQFRSPSWLKIKCLKRQEFVIGGFTKPSGSRTGFGALLLGYYDDGRLVYAGRVGTGFTHDSLRELSTELKKRRTDQPPFAKPLKRSQARGVTWVRPELVGDVEFTEWTDEGLLRHPSFQGLREDKPPRQIIRETPRAITGRSSNAPKSQSKAKRGRSHMAAKKSDATVAGVRITHPDRVLYPDEGLTKRALAEFFEQIAEWILPHVVDRPLTLVRCPQGQSGSCFFQKHLTGSLPDAVRGVAIQEKGKRQQYIVIDDLPGLVSLVQMGVLEVHPWPAREENLEKPDRIVFDLDPGPGVQWRQVVSAARDVRRHIEQHGLKSFVRTSGGKGLHVVVPLKPGNSWDEVKTFAKTIAQDLARDDPDTYVTTASKAKRAWKVFIDYLRNSRGATAVASYSTRARPGAPLAMPLRWEELSTVNAADQFTVANAIRRLSALKTDPWKDFTAIRQSL